MVDKSRMNKLINDLSDESFKYGKNDCFTFTAKLVRAWHDVDYLSMHLVYKNKREADEYMKRHGGIEALTTGTLGYSVDPSRCVDGDVATCEVAEGQVALGFVFGGRAYFKHAKRVLVVPLKVCRRGWRIT